MKIVRRVGKSLKEIIYGDSIITYDQAKRLKKARALPVGTIREWSGKKYKKGPSGKWFPVREGEKQEKKPEKEESKGKSPDIDKFKDRTIRQNEKVTLEGKQYMSQGFGKRGNVMMFELSPLNSQGRIDNKKRSVYLELENGELYWQGAPKKPKRKVEG
jgi:hypothetical protein